MLVDVCVVPLIVFGVPVDVDIVPDIPDESTDAHSVVTVYACDDPVDVCNVSMDP